ncbi:MAG: response regulator [Elusimicrobiota bacterium]|nr:MAG: response regulator [Elusimicrobiota bacterium]
MPPQIIIVDDDPLVGGLTLELLNDAGYSSILIQDSLKAQDAIKAAKPALVVLDILMPGLDGLTLLHRLKSDPETQSIRAIVVSGKSFEAEKQRAAQYGAEAFIEKPYDVDLFAQKVKEIMDKAGAAPGKIARPLRARADRARRGQGRRLGRPLDVDGDLARGREVRQAHGVRVDRDAAAYVHLRRGLRHQPAGQRVDEERQAQGAVVVSHPLSS